MKDDVQLKEYKIIDGAKLMLTRIKPLNLRQLLVNHFQQSFDQTTANKFSDLFIQNLKKNISSEYSLDDIERIASSTWIRTQ